LLGGRFELAAEDPFREKVFQKAKHGSSAWDGPQV
jgi:hypothetical protein